MNKSRILEQVCKICSTVFNTNDQLSELTTSEEVENWNSMNHVILMQELENEFALQFDLFEMVELRTIGDIANYISKKLSAN